MVPEVYPIHKSSSVCVHLAAFPCSWAVREETVCGIRQVVVLEPSGAFSSDTVGIHAGHSVEE